jgi:hypothetical protein
MTHDALVDGGIDAHRQMRTMLLDGADRKHGDDLAHVEVAEVFGGQIPPPVRLDV